VPPAKRTLDLTRVEIKPLSHDTAANRFCCGATPIDRFLKNKAKKAEKRHEYKTFCAHVDESQVCIGYYSLQIGTGKVAELPKEPQTYLTSSNQESFPAVNLAFLGVDEQYQRQGLGRNLIMDVFSRVENIATSAGLYALTLTSYDDKSTAFYKRIGFEVYVESRQPKMFYPIEGIIILNKEAREATEVETIAISADKLT
jgi:GNAT superfamily N-acetyltransferase